MSLTTDSKAIAAIKPSCLSLGSRLRVPKRMVKTANKMVK